MRTKTTAIFGQGPNESGWRRWVKRYRGDLRRAEAEAARVAITGECGELLAELLGVLPLTLYARCHRFNLNARWSGKSYGVDMFDKVEAYRTSQRILAEHPEIERVICLGRNVGEVMGFGMRDPFLTTIKVTSKSENRSFLLFPHPSGRNRFWNDPLNRRNAARRLREFLHEPQPERKS
jgi:uracil-DNA glycosylase